MRFDVHAMEVTLAVAFLHVRLLNHAERGTHPADSHLQINCTGSLTLEQHVCCFVEDERNL